jgi:hypothetical protein
MVIGASSLGSDTLKSSTACLELMHIGSVKACITSWLWDPGFTISTLRSATGMSGAGVEERYHPFQQ